MSFSSLNFLREFDLESFVIVIPILKMHVNNVSRCQDLTSGSSWSPAPRSPGSSTPPWPRRYRDRWQTSECTIIIIMASMDPCINVLPLQSQSLGWHHKVLAWKLPQSSWDRRSPGWLHVPGCWWGRHHRNFDQLHILRWELWRPHLHRGTQPWWHHAWDLHRGNKKHSKFLSTKSQQLSRITRRRLPASSWSAPTSRTCSGTRVTPSPCPCSPW